MSNILSVTGSTPVDYDVIAQIAVFRYPTNDPRKILALCKVKTILPETSSCNETVVLPEKIECTFHSIS